MYLLFCFSAADLVASIVGVKRPDSSSDLPETETGNETKKVKLEVVADDTEDDVAISSDKMVEDSDIKDEDPSEDDKMALR